MLPSSGSTAPPTNALGTGAGLTVSGARGISAVNRQSEVWLFIEYLLMIATRTSRVRVRQVWELSVPAVVNRFENRTRGRLTVFSWTDTRGLDQHNSIQEVCRRGFKVAQKGMKFALGNFSLPGFPLMNIGDPVLFQYMRELESNSQVKGHGMRKMELERTASHAKYLTTERRIYEFFLSEVGIGKGYPVEDELGANGERFTCPTGFDSAYIKSPSVKAPSETLSIYSQPAESEVADNEHVEGAWTGKSKSETVRGLPPEVGAIGVLPQHTFRHEYVIYDSSQVVPRYLVQFECDPTLKELFAVPLCDNCQEASASLWCAADAARLCMDCDTAMHSHNKIVTRHIRVPLNEMCKAFGKCVQHPDDTYELFCTVCRVPLCRLCRPSHLHSSASSSGDSANVALMDLNMAYRAALQRCKAPHVVLDPRRRRIQERLDEVQSLLDDVRGNCLEAEQQIFSIAEQAMSDLQRLTEQKMSVLLAEKLEADRQLSQIQWSENFIKYAKSVLPSPDFLMTWLRHCRVREEFELLGLNASQNSDAIFADMRLEGRVDIFTDATLRHEAQHKDI